MALHLSLPLPRTTRLAVLGALAIQSIVFRADSRTPPGATAPKPYPRTAVPRRPRARSDRGTARAPPCVSVSCILQRVSVSVSRRHRASRPARGAARRRPAAAPPPPLSARSFVGQRATTQVGEAGRATQGGTDMATEKKFLAQSGEFERWMAAVLEARGFDADE